MQLRSRVLPVLAAVALVGAACADQDAPNGDPDQEVEEGTEEGAVDDDASDDDASEDDGTDESGTEAEDGEDDEDAGGEDEAGAVDDPDPAGVVTTGIEVADSDLGAHIVTAEGMTTYGAVDQRDGEVTCEADCAQVWQPVLVEGEPEVGEDVDAEVTTIEREDGGVQVVVDGSPLHTFVVDSDPGDVQGQGSAERWFVVSATGELVDAPDPSETDDEDAEDA